MAKLAMIFGVLLVALGLAGLYGSTSGGWRLWVPAVAGVLLFVLGVVGLKASFRRTAMHVASAVALIGLLITIPRLARLLADIFGDWERLSSATTAVLCGLFVVLAVKSFLDARRARKRAERGKP